MNFKKDYNFWLCFSAVFCVSCNHFMQRPLRDLMAVFYGTDQLNWLMTGTFIVTVGLSWILYKTEKLKNLSVALPFFLIGLAFVQVIFYSQLQSPDKMWSMIYFIFTSTINLTLLSLIWSRMPSIVTEPAAVISLYTASNLGAVAGPLITFLFSHFADTTGILIFSSCLMIAVACLLFILQGVDRNPKTQASTDSDERSEFSFRKFSFFIFTYTVVSTGFYYLLIQTVSINTIPETGILIFTWVDITINTLALLLPRLFTRVITRYTAFLIVPFLSLILMIMVGIHTSIVSVVLAIVIFKVSNLIIQRPAREFIFAQSGMVQPYSKRNFIDTVVYRFGDATGSWAIYIFATAGASGTLIAYLFIPIILIWLFSATQVTNFLPKQFLS